MFRTRFVDKSKPDILCSITLFERRAVCDTTWKNIVEPSRPRMIKWCMRFASWISKATNTHSEYVILIAFPRQEWLHNGPSNVALYVHCLSC